MKKVLFAIFAVILLIGLAACSKSPTTTPSVTTPTETETTGNFTEEPIETTSPLVSYTIYIPNDNANGFVTDTVQTDDISADSVLAELKKRNALPDGVSIHSFSMENGLITIDFNQAFSDVVRSMGTSGELMVVGSVVNTFLDAFQAEKVSFTVDGEFLESGHTIYDFPLSFFSIEP